MLRVFPKFVAMRLLLLEDHSHLAEAIVCHLRRQKFVVDWLQSIRQARQALTTEGIAVAVLDLSLPDGDALDLLRDIRARGSHLPVLLITARDQISDRVRGLQAGADDYLVKPFDLDELVARIHAVLRRAGGNPNPTLRFGEFEVDRNGHRILRQGLEVQLTAKEWCLLERLLINRQSIVSKDQLEEAIYGFDDEVGSNTLEVYVSRLRKKLGKAAIETVRGLGYRFTGGQA
jgi:two-component system OmpR family response regulator